MGLRDRHGDLRAGRRIDDRCRPGGARAGAALHRAHVLCHGARRARQHERHAGCGRDTGRCRKRRADLARNIVGPCSCLRHPPGGARCAARWIVRQIRPMRGWRAYIAGSVVLLSIAVVLAWFVGNEYFFFAAYVVLQFIVLATAWNILGGYAGYVNFGSGAFFAVGAYTSVGLFKAFGAPLPVLIIAAALVTGTLGFAIGVMTLRLRGIFFSIATVAIAVICETVVVNWSFVGGSRGMAVLTPLPLAFASYNRLLFVVMSAIALLAVGTARYIEISRIGRGLRAIRDSEQAAESVGVPTLRLKVLAASISGALMGLAGAPFALYMSFIEPTSAFSLNYAVSALAMPIIGGTATWIGPVIGALLLGTTQQIVTVTVSSELNVLVIGLLLVGFVVLAPHGILGLL